MKEIELVIKGMSCGYCKLDIEKALTDLFDVESAEVNLRDKKVRINYDDNILDVKILKGAIQEVGYEVV